MPVTAHKNPRSLEVILGLLPLVFGLQLIIWIVYLPAALRGNADFRNCYTAGIILKSGQGHQIYDYRLQKEIQDALISQSPMVLPYVHLPYEALLFVPLALLTYRHAYLCLLALNLLCLFGCYRMLREKLWRLNALWWCFPFLFVLAFMPVPAALMQGQDSLLTLLLFAGALSSLEAGKDLQAGLLVGFAVFKFQLVIPIVALFFLWRRWRFVVGSSISVLTSLSLSVLVSGFASLAGYVRSLHEISTKFTAAGQILYLMPVARMPNIRGLVLSIPHLAPGAAIVLVAILSGAVVLLAAWSARNAPAPWQLAIAISTTTLVGYHVLTHDLSILLVPIAMLLSRREARGLWIIPIVWLSTVLCFFALDYWVTVPLLAFFFSLVLQVRHSSTDDQNSTPRRQFAVPSYSTPAEIS